MYFITVISKHKNLALSTFIAPLSGSPEEVLECWKKLSAAGISALSTDPRFSLPFLRMLFQLQQRQGLVCVETAHPLYSEGNQGSASPISADPDERYAARHQILDTLRLAAEYGVERVLLYPAQLELTISRAELARRHGQGLPLGIEDLRAEREARAQMGVDRLCQVLDPVLNTASRWEIRLALLTPSPWPHQVPDQGEVQKLLHIFAGAPLAECYRTDWAYLAGILDGGQPVMTLGDRAVAAVHVADACGFTTRLPLGCGEIETAMFFPDAVDLEMVLTCNQTTTALEIKHSLELLARSST